MINLEHFRDCNCYVTFEKREQIVEFYDECKKQKVKFNELQPLSVKRYKLSQLVICYNKFDGVTPLVYHNETNTIPSELYEKLEVITWSDYKKIYSEFSKKERGNMKAKEILKWGMCVEFRNGMIGLYDGYNFFDISDMQRITRDDLLNDDLNDIHKNDKFDVVKIWKNYTMKELLWERKTQILDEVEKRYLENVSKPFRNRIKFIRKQLNFMNSTYYIIIQLINYDFIPLPYFSATSPMYKGMELNKKYTLKEMGLFEHNYKITLKEFFESKKELVIHCDTKEKSIKLLKAFDKLGKRWCNGDSYLDHNNIWGVYEEKTCYYNNGMFGTFDYAKEHRSKIYEFEEVDLGENN